MCHERASHSLQDDQDFFYYRLEGIVDSLRNEPVSKIASSLASFSGEYFERYPRRELAKMELSGVNDISRHMTLIEQILDTAYARYGESCEELKLAVLDNLANVQDAQCINSLVRPALATLSAHFLARGDNRKALGYAERSLALDSRCLNSQHLYLEARKRLHQDDLTGAGTGVATGITEPHGLSERFCSLPFTTMVINPTGDVHLCCPLSIPVSIGNIFRQNWTEIWNSREAQAIRRSIHDGSFRYCNRSHCHFIAGGRLPFRRDALQGPLGHLIREGQVRMLAGPQTVDFGEDSSCNLHCPQCRTQRQFAKGEERKRLNEAKEHVILPLLKEIRTAIITNSGDPFASPHYRSVLSCISKDDHPQLQQIEILTNGVLLTPRMWSRFGNLHHLEIHIKISIDAATKKTYDLVRPGGNWDRLMQNLEYIGQLRKQGIVNHLEIRFVVQACNYREMPDFVRLGERIDADLVSFTQLGNMGTYTSSDFVARTVFEENHPDHADLLQTLRHPALTDQHRVWLCNLSDLWRSANSDKHPIPGPDAQ